MSRERDDHFAFELQDNPKSKTGKSPKMTAPSSIIRIPDREELRLQLKHYSRPFIKHQLPDNQFARKTYVEKVRPALRYYCQKFGINVPDWLKDERYFENLPDKEKLDMFGTLELKIAEFKPLPKFVGGQAQGG